MCYVLTQVELTVVKMRVYLGVKTCEVFLCFIAIFRVRAYYDDFFVFFVSQVLTPRVSLKYRRFHFDFL